MHVRAPLELAARATTTAAAGGEGVTYWLDSSSNNVAMDPEQVGKQPSAFFRGVGQQLPSFFPSATYCSSKSLQTFIYAKSNSVLVFLGTMDARTRPVNLAGTHLISLLLEP